MNNAQNRVFLTKFFKVKEEKVRLFKVSEDIVRK